MENRKISQWITVNGNHIPIFEGESKKQAVDNFIKRQAQVKAEERQKERQISASKNDTPVIKERKSAQLAIIQKYNPKDKNINAQATWVESEKDIKTWDETMDDEWGYSAGDDVTEDFTWKDALEAQKSGYITVYSSKPIQQGTFVTPSKMIAVSYGNKNPYSKKIPVDKVAWIDRSEGQFADVEAEKENKQTVKEEPKQLTRKEKEEAWNKKIDDVIKKHIDNTQIKAGKPTKNSDSIFKANFYSVSKDIKNGKTYDTLTSLYGYDKENEYINSKQTMSGIQYLINKRIEDAKTDFRIGVIDNTEFNQELKTLKIIQNTLNRIKQEKKW